MLEVILPSKKFLEPCFGIKRSFDSCLSIKDKNKFLIYGQIAHNKALCERLENEGFTSIDGLEKVKNKKVIIRAHGITKQDLDFLKQKKIEFINLTCPFVEKLLNISLKFEKDGYQVIIIGDKNHIEIKNVCSYLKSPLVVDNETDLKNSSFPKVAVLCQTTQTLEKIERVLPFIKRKYKKVVYVSTRCPETEQRQKQAAILAEKVDLMLVIGDTISKNANNLVKISKKITKAALVLQREDINKISFYGIKKVGLIASASTPSFVVDELIEFLKEKY
ncbi:MAG: 4-hydroxy-3-methylbut-2-enyl diphosphate reductase [Patescibacteria group bacterium]|nr:4-hydroxy-3-methylbut-2-enyl diphosphate reductase [Patescibacteria group bacterium]